MRMAEFVHDLELDSLPDEVVEKARTCVLNGYGIALGSHTTPFFSLAAQAVLAMDGEREQGATLLADGRKSTVAGAALSNAALFHGRAQEDTCGVAHFGAVLLPLLTALVEAGEGPVERLLPSLIAGYEVGGLLETAYSATTTGKGLRASPLYGTLAAAAAVAKFRGLDAERTAAALCNAASFTGGILQSFGDGTDEWRYQVGIAGRNGLAAARLAEAGSVSAQAAFEGRSGFVRTYVGEDCDVQSLVAKLGVEWSVPKVTFKPYPVCALNQTPVIAALALRAQLAGAELRAVRIRMNPTCVGYAGMNSTGPFGSLSGSLMSIQFCVATTLVHGEPSVARMSDFDDSAVKALMPHIQPIADPDYGLLACRIEADVAGRDIPLVQERRVDHTEYSYDRLQVSALIRRVGMETGVPEQAYECLERFTEALPRADLNDVLKAFEAIQ
ncbi:MmgE/PrpD family protein 4 [Billgrantia endophytica]|uniref:MmgE/PrpD family protein 4 n=2 Tax=Billgrantia endophytica TaxID=2033802 RepID=A0A2N7U2Z7_9GAMM|nr:MmgE/PrpD family protein 4 [Halomonas endophytica]